MTKKQKIKKDGYNQKVIGIVSGKRGEGVTTMAVSMAAYLSGVFRAKVALVEHNKNNDFSQIARAYYGETRDDEEFPLYKVDYYSHASSQKVSEILNRNYEYVVIDFGSDYQGSINEFMRCSKKIVMGSFCMWRYGEYLELCKFIETIEGAESWLHVLNGDSKYINAIERKKKIKAVKRLNIDDPYVVGSTEIEYFDKII